MIRSISYEKVNKIERPIEYQQENEGWKYPNKNL